MTKEKEPLDLGLRDAGLIMNCPDCLQNGWTLCLFNVPNPVWRCRKCGCEVLIFPDSANDSPQKESVKARERLYTNEELLEEIQVVWENIVLEDDAKLTGDAKELKQKLLAICRLPEEE